MNLWLKESIKVGCYSETYTHDFKCLSRNLSIDVLQHLIDLLTIGILTLKYAPCMALVMIPLPLAYVFYSCSIVNHAYAWITIKLGVICAQINSWCNRD